MKHQNLFNAFQEANGRVPCGIAYHQGKGWSVYDLTQGTDGTPDFVHYQTGHMPICLNEDAYAGLLSLIQAIVK